MSWTIDPAHTLVQFSVRHMMISKVRGQFEKFSGEVNLDENNPAATTVDVNIETASVNTREPQRDGHLKSPDFFDFGKIPDHAFCLAQSGSDQPIVCSFDWRPNHQRPNPSG